MSVLSLLVATATPDPGGPLNWAATPAMAGLDDWLDRSDRAETPGHRCLIPGPVSNTGRTFSRPTSGPPGRGSPMRSTAPGVRCSGHGAGRRRVRPPRPGGRHPARPVRHQGTAAVAGPRRAPRRRRPADRPGCARQGLRRLRRRRQLLRTSCATRPASPPSRLRRLRHPQQLSRTPPRPLLAGRRPHRPGQSLRALRALPPQENPLQTRRRDHAPTRRRIGGSGLDSARFPSQLVWIYE